MEGGRWRVEDGAWSGGKQPEARGSVLECARQQPPLSGRLPLPLQPSEKRGTPKLVIPRLSRSHPQKSGSYGYRTPKRCREAQNARTTRSVLECARQQPPLSVRLSLPLQPSEKRGTPKLVIPRLSRSHPQKSGSFGYRTPKRYREAQNARTARSVLECARQQPPLSVRLSLLSDAAVSVRLPFAHLPLFSGASRGLIARQGALRGWDDSFSPKVV
jgi:hypothetical protein